MMNNSIINQQSEEMHIGRNYETIHPLEKEHHMETTRVTHTYLHKARRQTEKGP